MPEYAPMSTLRGLVSLLLMSLNTIFSVLALVPFALVKFVVPVDAVRKLMDRVLNAIAGFWVANNLRMFHDVRVDVRGDHELSRQRWYLVVANHQSWADIFVLHSVLSRRIPFLKFFLKQQLIWVPVIGFAWWALDFPFMKRHSQEFLRKHPERRGDDLAAIRRACEKFSLIPTAVMNFLEGTRFTTAKHREEGGPYRHLLIPKAGGVALALNAMGERFHSLLDVTLFYPGGAPTFFGLLAGRMKEVIVHLRELPIPSDLLGGNYAADPAFRERVQEWVRGLWLEKDAILESLRLETAARV